MHTFIKCIKMSEVRASDGALRSGQQFSIRATLWKENHFPQPFSDLHMSTMAHVYTQSKHLREVVFFVFVFLDSV